MSEEYNDVLKSGLDNLNKHNQSDEEVWLIRDQYEREFATIERIRNHEYDLGFIYEEPERRLYLRKQK